jgi:signal transduction histidine kinase
MDRRWRFIRGPSDLYVGKSTLLKVFLVVGVVVISAVFIWYTFAVIDKLQTDTRDRVEKYVRLWQLAATSPPQDEETSGRELQFIFDEIIVKAAFPLIVLNRDKEPVSWRNIAGVAAYDTSAASLAHLRDVAREMYEHNGEYPLYFGETQVNFLRYGDSEVINRLKMMPFIEIGIVLAFMIAGIIGFQNIRRSEERYIWVGMAKETAHQLGTPLSSLMGWLEVLEGERGEESDRATNGTTLDDTAANMKADVERLQRVANRFGMIGSVPELSESNLNEIVAEVVAYYRRRLPFEGRGIQIDFTAGDTPPVRLNPQLFGWVLENLVKNSLQAVDSKEGQVTISTGTSPDKRSVVVHIADNGKGIPVAAARKIFRPGFTTKKRGWGMGLTLVKRIVEEYHVGRVSLVRSRPGETMFEIMLPISGDRKA